jgi:hypothetical protein
MGDPSSSTVLAAPGTEAKVVIVKDAYDYKKGVFDKGYRGRFDGRVDRRRGIIQLIVRCSWSALVDEWKDGSGLSSAGEKALREYQTQFKTVIEQGWSAWWEIEPSYPVDQNFRYRAEVVIENVGPGDDPHLKIRLRSGYTDVVSSATVDPKGSDADSNRIMNLKLESATMVRDTGYHTVDFPVPPATMEVQYSRCTAVHEFGHHIGLHHPAPKWDAEIGSDQLKAYGETAEQASGVMGWGAQVKKGDYEPFLQIARRYSAEAAPKETRNQWTLVSPVQASKKKP